MLNGDEEAASSSIHQPVIERRRDRVEVDRVKINMAYDI